jgi:hypothetical protein
MKFLLLAILVGVAAAQCPNGCSGHGSCVDGATCICYPGWINNAEPGILSGGDCSEMECPVSYAWFDTPNAQDEAHGLAECGNRGICDRTTGTCACLPGFEGEACERTTCPGGNTCNGHGVCRFLNELRNDVGNLYKYSGVSTNPNRELLDTASSLTFKNGPQYAFQTHRVWDFDKARGCECDPEWYGIDCSLRNCPRAFYTSQTGIHNTDEIQQITIMGMNTTVKDFALKFRSLNGLEYHTISLDSEAMYSGTAPYDTNANAMAAIQSELRKLPNAVLRTAICSGFTVQSTWPTPTVQINVTFVGPELSGDQYAFECITNICTQHCQPTLINALGQAPYSASCTVQTVQQPTTYSFECSARGKCDPQTAQCNCFNGWTGHACQTQTQLI